MLKQINILLSLIIVAFLLLYFFFDNYNNTKFIKNLLFEWSIQTYKGNITLDGHSNFKNDYYLSFGRNLDYYSHIHIIIGAYNCDLCYVIKKNNNHSIVHKIDKNKNVKDIVKKMIDEYKEM